MAFFAALHAVLYGFASGLSNKAAHTAVRSSHALALDMGLTSKQPLRSLLGVQVAVVNTHMTDNLGDEMETSPLLKKLSDWGMKVDVYASDYAMAEDHLKIWRPRGYEVTFVPEKFQDWKWRWKYDVVMVAPGPELTTCSNFRQIKKKQRLILFVGGSLSGAQALSLSGASTLSRQNYSSCYDFFWFREGASFQALAPDMDPMMDVGERFMFSGDFSHSFYPDDAAVKHWQEHYQQLASSFFGPEGESIVVFSRSSNADAGVRVRDGVLTMSVMKPGEKAWACKMSSGCLKQVSFPVTKVVFVSSQPSADSHYFSDLERSYHVPKERLIFLNSLEEMFGLLSAFKDVQVFSDRYHGAVASYRLGKNLTIIGYARGDGEGKMQGLNEMITTPASQQTSVNKRAFKNLHRYLQERLP